MCIYIYIYQSPDETFLFLKIQILFLDHYIETLKCVNQFVKN